MIISLLPKVYHQFSGFPTEACWLAGQPVIFCWQIFAKFQLDKYDFDIQNGFVGGKNGPD
jgi:hypothetical protein